MTERKLTEKQQKFLEVLFNEARGDYNKAKHLAGYSPTIPSSSIVASLEDEIFEATKKFILQGGTKAAFHLYEVMENPMQAGNKERMAAAKDFLDRAGFGKTEKVEVKSESPLFVLPPKDEDV